MTQAERLAQKLIERNAEIEDVLWKTDNYYGEYKYLAEDLAAWMRALSIYCLIPSCS